MIVKDFLFAPSPEGYGKMSMKFCWPGDLDGDGKYDYVVDRYPGGVVEVDDAAASGKISGFIEAYTSEGVLKWRIKLGINVITGSGQADMLTVYDFNHDGKADVCMAVSEGTTFADGTVITHADGTVHDYTNVLGSTPQWIAVVDGQTGNLIDKAALSYFDELKSDRTDKWKDFSGQCAVQYLDGIHPYLTYQYKTRHSDGGFQGATETWRYENGKLVKFWAQRFHRESTEFEGHQYRVADVDGDGKDELVQVSYTIDDDGSLLNTVPGIAHGDRHCLADIDPDRPGLEHFFIQQSNILGMGINDAATGEIIKANYLASVADVGRGVCGALDVTRRGMQYFSTMSGNAMYDCKGALIPENHGTFPAEMLWWGPGMSRMMANAAGGDKNPTVDYFHPTEKAMWRYQSLYKSDISGAPSDYYTAAPNGGRAAFWGDILGDWREELVYARRDTLGFVIMSTWDLTTHRQYCLMQNPAYRGQSTIRGYYETADVDFYMAEDMPLPPVSPVQTADLYLTSENSITTSANGKSLMLDIRNANTEISLNENVELTRLWLMNPKGHDYTISGTGKFTGSMEVVKSLQGRVTLNTNNDYTGVTRISEGKLFVNGSLAGQVRVDARGVIGGNAALNGGIKLETGLNIEGGRLEPGNGAALGTLIIQGGLTLPGRNNLAFDIDQTKVSKSDKLEIKGDFTINGTNCTLVIQPHTGIKSDTLSLISFTGNSNASVENLKIVGLEGVPFTLLIDAHSIKIAIKSPRSAGQVSWDGSNGSSWDFETMNFKYGANNDIFVPGDSVLFNDNAKLKTVVLSATMPVSDLKFINNTNYSISGTGVISGTGGLTKTGTGTLTILNEENSFTGPVDFSNGILEVKSLKDGGAPSSIGASAGIASNWIMRNATLQSASQMATNRSMTIEGTLTVNNPTTTHSIMISGNIGGANAGLKLIGQGTLNLQGENTFSNVLLGNGTLALGSVDANSKALGAAVVTMEGGTLQMRDANSTSNVGPWTNTIVVPAGKTARWNLPMRWNFKNILTGAGTLNVYIPYVRAEFQGDWSQFEGTIRVLADADGGDFRINNTYGYAKANINLDENAYFYSLNTSRTIKLGSLSGVATSKVYSDNMTWVVGGNNATPKVFAGVISGAASKLTKEGTGTLTLSGANTYTGLTDVTGGSLIVANTTGSATGTNNITVRTGASLSGNGKIAGGVTVYASSNLALQNNLLETLSVGGSLTLASSSKMTVDLYPGKLQSDVVSVGGNLSIGSNLEIVRLGSTEFQDGQEFKIFNVTGTISGGFATITPILENKLGWDQSKLLTDGILMVKTVTGVDTPTSSKEVLSVEYFNLTGYKVPELTEGFVIRKTIYTDGSVELEKKFNKF